jgi:hypothetical protein
LPPSIILRLRTQIAQENIPAEIDLCLVALILSVDVGRADDHRNMSNQIFTGSLSVPAPRLVDGRAAIARKEFFIFETSRGRGPRFAGGHPPRNSSIGMLEKKISELKFQFAFELESKRVWASLFPFNG